KRREIQQAKGADRLGPQGRWPGGGGPASSPADVAPPVNRQSLPHPWYACGTWEARIAPFARKVGKPRGRPMAVRVWGVGKSEGRLVMRRIRVAPVVSATSPDAQAGRLPCGVSAREPGRNRYRRCGEGRWLRATVATFPARASTSVKYRAASRW